MPLPPSMPEPSMKLLGWPKVAGLLPAPEEVVAQEMPGVGRGHGMTASMFRKQVTKRRNRKKIAAKSKKKNRRR